MIQLAEKDSEIFGLPFGRVLLEDNFMDWALLKEAIEDSVCRFIRVKIKNFNSEKLSKLNSFDKKLHLLEVLQIHRTPNLIEIPTINDNTNLNYTILTNKQQLAELIKETYTDKPFGNYFPAHLLNQFPLQKQLDCLTAYFSEYHTGKDKNKNTQLFYDNNALIGLTITEVYTDKKGERILFPNYVAVLPEQRNKGYQSKICTVLKQMAIEQKLMYVEGSVRLSNAHSINGFRKAGYKVINNDWIYLIEK